MKQVYITGVPGGDSSALGNGNGGQKVGRKWAGNGI